MAPQMTDHIIGVITQYQTKDLCYAEEEKLLVKREKRANGSIESAFVRRKNRGGWNIEQREEPVIKSDRWHGRVGGIWPPGEST